jgi:hypothetical protein
MVVDECKEQKLGELLNKPPPGLDGVMEPGTVVWSAQVVLDVQAHGADDSRSI